MSNVALIAGEVCCVLGEVKFVKSGVSDKGTPWCLVKVNAVDFLRGNCDKTEFFNVWLSKKQAEIAAERLSVGSVIMVLGKWKDGRPFETNKGTFPTIDVQCSFWYEISNGESQVTESNPFGDN